jgi:hypothetical protein
MWHIVLFFFYSYVTVWLKEGYLQEGCWALSPNIPAFLHLLGSRSRVFFTKAVTPGPGSLTKFVELQSTLANFWVTKVLLSIWVVVILPSPPTFSSTVPYLLCLSRGQGCPTELVLQTKWPEDPTQRVPSWDRDWSHLRAWTWPDLASLGSSAHSRAWGLWGLRRGPCFSSQHTLSGSLLCFHI